MSQIRNCSGCKAKPGQSHQFGCDNEFCALCGRQSIICGCVYSVNGIDRDTLEDEYPNIYIGGPTQDMYTALDAAVEKVGGRVPWSGEFSGTAECREYQWYVKWSDGLGWTPANKDHPGAVPDLNRLFSMAKWNSKTRRYERKQII